MANWTFFPGTISPAVGFVCVLVAWPLSLGGFLALVILFTQVPWLGSVLCDGALVGMYIALMGWAVRKSS